MQVSKSDGIYKAVRITGSQDNFLGLSIACAPCDPELIVPSSTLVNEERVRTRAEEIMRQVAVGLARANDELGSTYFIAKIFYIPRDLPNNDIYEMLTLEILRYFHAEQSA
ncbi:MULTISPECIES: hypothetical protein [unclassified Pseudoxanthomonas]|uniref:hypothetical protein n=1 Tax=unclassified Pseudoxanthomonas TaxID=2645906 RepID=UPI00307E6C07